MNNVNKLKFKHVPLKIFDPKWNSNLANIIIELEKLRIKQLGGPVPPYIFFQLKNVFQIFESLGSARIEGNNTTLAEFVEKIIEDPDKKTRDEKIKEIYNIEKAINFIEKNVNKKIKIDRALISEIHRILVEGLSLPPIGEGSRYSGKLRPVNVIINKSKHTPPNSEKVPDYFEELISFVNKHRSTQYHLLSVAIAHHRMAWIHPFDNGNGRLVRMFTYAQLIKQDFQVKNGRILNPTAVFCMNRKKYYEMLELADSGKPDKVLQWCEFVLSGLQKEIEKIDNLLNKKYILESILLPTIGHALDRKSINELEYNILKATIQDDKMTIRSMDLKNITGGVSQVQRSRIIKKLREKRMLIPIKRKGRIYTIGFQNNYLLRSVMMILKRNKFIPDTLISNNDKK